MTNRAVYQWGLQPLREGIAVPFFDHGINTTDGAFHQYSRSLVRPTFARTAVANLGFLEKHTDHLVAQLPKDGATVDLQPFFSCLVSSVIRSLRRFLTYTSFLML